MDIHHYELQHKSAIEHVKNSKLSKKNKEIILNFHKDLVLDNLSKPRLITYLSKLRMLGLKLGNDFDKAKLNDLKELVSTIQNAPYSPWTKQTYKVIIREFYQWMGKPDIVSWISIKFSKSEKKLPSEGDLITEKEVQKLISAADHPRNKAFISSLWESGARISELGNLKIKHISFDQIGTVITVQGKTGSRQIRLITSTPHLSTWIQNHPYKDSPDSSLWINIGTVKHNKVMTYKGMAKILRDVFQKVGIKKRCNPHLFRHSRATFMANQLTEFQMNQYFGWTQGSDMPSTYVHMSGKQVDDAILSMNGLKKKEETEEIKPPICPRCDTINSKSSKHCCKCGGILDLKYAMEMDEKRNQELEMRSRSDEIMNLLFKDEDVLRIVKKKIKELPI